MPVGSAFAVSRKLKYKYSFRCFTSFVAALPTNEQLLCQTLTCFANDRHLIFLELQRAFPIATRSVQDTFAKYANVLGCRCM